MQIRLCDPTTVVNLHSTAVYLKTFSLITPLDTQIRLLWWHHPLGLSGSITDCDVVVLTVMCLWFSQGLSGGTTVSATMIAAHRAGIPVFVTGGIGGVHRDGQNSKRTHIVKQTSDFE